MLEWDSCIENYSCLIKLEYGTYEQRHNRCGGGGRERCWVVEGKGFWERGGRSLTQKLSPAVAAATTAWSAHSDCCFHSINAVSVQQQGCGAAPASKVQTRLGWKPHSGWFLTHPPQVIWPHMRHTVLASYNPGCLKDSKNGEKQSFCWWWLWGKSYFPY